MSTRHCIAVLTAVAFLFADLAAVVGPTRALAQGSAITGPAAGAPGITLTGGDCEVDDEDAFRERVRELAVTTFRDGIARVDVPLVVADQWRENAFAALIDRLVDEAADQLREETDWDQLVATLADSDKAKALAERMAERVYRSDAFKTAVEELAGDAGREIASHIELATIDAAVPAVRCVRTYLGNRYGRGIARLVAEDTRAEFDPTAEGVAASVGTGQVVVAGSEAIAGAMVLLVRRTLERMARRVGQRVVGAVLSRIVSVIAGGVGVVLIAKDIWELRHGVLPIIAEEMKSETAKEAVKREIAASISEQMAAQIDELATTTADRIVAVWHEFRSAHQKVIDLAVANPTFRTFVDGIPRVDLPRLDRIVALVVTREGEEGISRRLADGSLTIAMRELPPAALEIADDTGELALGFAWLRLAGGRIEDVANYELHRSSRPDDFSEATLTAILALADRLAIARILELPADARRVLAELETGRLRTLARSLTSGELDTLSGYVTGLATGARERILVSLSEDPRRMQSLAIPGVRRAVLASRDQAAALGVALASTGAFDLFALQRTLSAVLRGDISPYLLAAKHPYAIGTALILLFFAYLFLRRLLFGPRYPRERTRPRRAEPRDPTTAT
ncbi:MAG: hypothetical protein GC150_09365 [Rhizobiales bacterium]|nr:hypothetical protein [Hyphomicrobiales bacterium]